MNARQNFFLPYPTLPYPTLPYPTIPCHVYGTCVGHSLVLEYILELRNCSYSGFNYMQVYFALSYI